MNDRMGALGRGEFGLAEGEQVGLGGLGQAGGAAFGDAVGGRGGPGGAGAGPGGGRGGVLGGRGGGNRFQMNASYGMGGSMFDASPHSLRPDQPAAAERDYLQQSFTTTFGGPVKFPGIYDGTNRTNFNFTYSGGRNGDMFDQYATVPSEAFKAGDFSSSATAIIDPLTGQPFPGNRIPTGSDEPVGSDAPRLLPRRQLAGQPAELSSHGHDLGDDRPISVANHPQPHAATDRPWQGRGRGGSGWSGPRGRWRCRGRWGAGSRGRGWRPGRGGRGNFQPPLNITMTATINYRRNDGDRLERVPPVVGPTKGSTISVPFSMNIRNGRWMHTIGTNFSRTTSGTLNTFAYRQDIAGLAGITGVATDPFDWGVPSLTFGTYTTLRDTAPSRRNDRSWQANYSLTRTFGTHNLRFGGSYQASHNKTQSDSNARGTFTFTGCTPPMACRRYAAVARTSPTSCSACLSKPRGNTAARSRTSASRVDQRSADERVLCRRLAAQGALDDQLRPAVRLPRALHRDGRAHGQPRRGA